MELNIITLFLNKFNEEIPREREREREREGHNAPTTLEPVRRRKREKNIYVRARDRE